MAVLRFKQCYIILPLVLAYVCLCFNFAFLMLDIIKYALFQILFLLLPGYIFCGWFVSEKLTKIERFIFGYPVSIIAILILSWIGRLFGFQYVECFLLVISGLAIDRLIRQRKVESYQEEGIANAVFIFFYVFCSVIVFRFFIIPSSPPTPEYPGLFYPDSLWNLDVVWSYVRGFPLEESKFSGVLIGYHMLKNIYQAVVYNYTRIQPFYIHFFIEPVFDWFMMVFLVFYGGLRIARFSLRQSTLFTFGLFASGSFLARGLQGHLFINPLTLYYSIPAFVLFAFYTVSYLNRQRDLDLAYLIILFTYFTATKSMLGFIIPVVLLLLFVLNFFKKSFPFSIKQIILGIGLLISLILLRMTLLNNTLHQLYYDYETTRSQAYAFLKNTPFLRNYADIIYPFYRFFSSLARNILNYFLNWQFLTFAALFGASKGFRKYLGQFKASLIFAAFFFLVTISMMCLFDFPGIRIYYAWYTQIVFLFPGVIAADYILRGKKIIAKFALGALLLFSVGFLYMDMHNWVKIGWGRFPWETQRIWDERASINYDEWQAMQWMRKNTGLHETFFTDRRYFSHEVYRMEQPTFYGYTALSGRQAFAEGETRELSGEYRNIASSRWELINKFLASQNVQEQKELLKSIKAGFFIQSLRFNKKDFSRFDEFQLVFENQSVKIYKILRRPNV